MYDAELIFLSLLVTYLILGIILALAFRWSYLRNAPSEDTGKDYYFQRERIVFTLAGFSLTALSLFVSLNKDNLNEISSTLTFFTIAFSCLILASIILRLRVRRIAVYISDVLLNTGLLSIGCGFFIFFGELVSWFNISTIIFFILIATLMIALEINFLMFLSSVEKSKEVTKTD